MKKALAALAVFAALSFGGRVICPIHEMDMYFTGHTRFEWGKMLQEYKCPMGHYSWVVE